MNVQYLIVGVMVVAAIWYIAKSVIKSSKGDCCENGNCGSKPQNKKFKNVE
ncbi:MAG: FeoB-associated Cys-rich membrane protein [Bacteroidia bacterium]|nr:FeoB-associated Cys-rich membrane protein [Bacteroidia bacterium]